MFNVSLSIQVFELQKQKFNRLRVGFSLSLSLFLSLFRLEIFSNEVKSVEKKNVSTELWLDGSERVNNCRNRSYRYINNVNDLLAGTSREADEYLHIRW